MASRPLLGGVSSGLLLRLPRAVRRARERTARGDEGGVSCVFTVDWVGLDSSTAGAIGDAGAGNSTLGTVTTDTPGDTGDADDCLVSAATATGVPATGEVMLVVVKLSAARGRLENVVQALGFSTEFWAAAAVGRGGVLGGGCERLGAAFFLVTACVFFSVTVTAAAVPAALRNRLLLRMTPAAA